MSKKASDDEFDGLADSSDSRPGSSSGTVRPRPHNKQFLQWIPTDSSQLQDVEHAILSKLGVPFDVNDLASIHAISTRCSAVPVAGEVAPPRAPPGPMHHIVLIHGFGGGLATWLPNYREIARVMAAGPDRDTTTVHAIDLPGFARSERRWRRIDSEHQAIEYMTSTVKGWLDAMGITAGDECVPGTKLTLVGHSFGAYVSAQCAMRFPRAVHHIVLADSWGVPVMTPDNDPSKLPFRFRMAMKLLYGFLPFSVLRGAGPFGPKLLPGVRKDFADRWKPYLDNTDDFYDYVYHCNASPQAVGELAFQQCCKGPVFAKAPLCESLPERFPRNVHLTVLYGNHTWMDKGAGREMLAQTGREHSGILREYHLIPLAGHQVASDNAEDFNRVVLEAIGNARFF